MRAWRLTKGNSRLVLTEVPEAPLERGEVRVGITASGLCQTDVSHLADRGARLRQASMTLGHESAGRVIELGDGVEGWSVGDRVTVQASMDGPGSARDGGYADSVVARVEELVALPDAVPDAVGALAADAGQTAFRAVVVKGGVRPGMRVGILGLGGLGLLGARIAVLNGAEVYGADVRADVFDLARGQGVLE
ncbi:MAG: alcohol dehydrogenase catalytic domain-containing protein, partial [Microbacterium sp.]